MVATEGERIANAPLVPVRRRVGIAANVVVHAAVHVLVVGAVLARVVVGGVEVLLTVEIDVADPLGDVRLANPASLEGDAGQRRVLSWPAAPRRIGRGAGGLVGRSGKEFIHRIVADIGGVIGPGHGGSADGPAIIPSDRGWPSRYKDCRRAAGWGS